MEKQNKNKTKQTELLYIWKWHPIVGCFGM